MFNILNDFPPPLSGLGTGSLHWRSSSYFYVLLGMLHKMTLLYMTYISRLNSTAHDTRDHILKSRRQKLEKSLVICLSYRVHLSHIINAWSVWKYSCL